MDAYFLFYCFRGAKVRKKIEIAKRFNDFF